jgi:hypothetical protein
MADLHWRIEELPWDRLDHAKVDPDLVPLIKAAALVEYNADDYTAYLCNVFHDDPEFQAAVRHWAEEEVRHGEALARWSRLADASFDFEARFRRFTDGFKLRSRRPLRCAAAARAS